MMMELALDGIITEKIVTEKTETNYPKVKATVTLAADSREELSSLLEALAQEIQGNERRLFTIEDGHRYLEAEVRAAQDEWRGATAEEIYQAYPRKIGKRAALASISTVVRNHGMAPEKLLELTKAFARMMDARGESKEYIPHASSWFRGWRWEDEALAKFIEQEHEASGRRPVELKANCPIDTVEEPSNESFTF